MNKVINIASFRKRKPVSKGSIAYEKTDYYKGLEEVRIYLMDELFLLCEEVIKKLGYDPAQFELDEESAKQYLKSDMVEFAMGGEESLCLCYKAIIEDVEYSVVAEAYCDNDEVDIESIFLKKEGKEWLAWNGEAWEEGPGYDFC